LVKGKMMPDKDESPQPGDVRMDGDRLEIYRDPPGGWEPVEPDFDLLEEKQRFESEGE
jgi:hypothetical protein